MPPLLLLLALGLSQVYCGSHTLRYSYTVVSDTGSDLPEFSLAGHVDDQVFMFYNSDIKQVRPGTRWMEVNEGPEYWDEETQILRGNEPTFRHNIRTVMRRFNQSGGVHYIQSTYGCELKDDGSISGFRQHGYDGRDFFFLDTQSGLHIPIMYEAQLTTQQANTPEVRAGEKWKTYLEYDCIEWLKKYIEYGKEDLEKKVRPEVKVWGRQHPDGVTRLQCLAYGFHPRAVDVKWVRNGEDHIPSDEASPILPHPDGTYQITVRVEVPTRVGNTYSCHVEHSSLEESLIVTWEPDSAVPAGVITGVIVFLVITAAIGGGLMYWRKLRGYRMTRTSDTNNQNA
ncbi:class I histocompatibility antigen, F10 alpha chain-like [Hyperolius riggenbachi]|uniref:class I histocompatibility antigen, F10 alpha chain-like n=1 Tax=Hyperolius riggenbachi TaxID=752182 RepID=UPI0035A27941